ncbi:MAG: hypothetical protein H6563_04990 [Lewinellaceae bacterium]|nr:hypothetical protein [Lewinellaceae bacterium]
MKNKIFTFLIFIALAAFLAPTTGCSPKYGCPAYESAHASTNRKGELSKKGGRSNLFPKNMRKHR